MNGKVLHVIFLPLGPGIVEFNSDEYTWRTLLPGSKRRIQANSAKIRFLLSWKSNSTYFTLSPASGKPFAGAVVTQTA